MAIGEDDLPHRVPGVAHLRWKENWFFVLIAPGQNAFGIVHLNHEPDHDRTRYTADFLLQGKRYSYAQEGRMPADFTSSRRIGNDIVGVELGTDGADFRLDFQHGDLAMNVMFDGTFPTFDYENCDGAIQGVRSFRDVFGMQANLPYHHQQQALRSRGTAVISSAGIREEIQINGRGYRDHSWCMRAESAVALFTWCNFHFPDKIVAAKTVRSREDPQIFAAEGYINDADGARPLSGIDLQYAPGPEKPGVIAHRLADSNGRRFTIEVDLDTRLADVALDVVRHGIPIYRASENFATCRIVETGESGIAHVEIGNPLR